MIWSIVIGILLTLYVLWVVRRKIRQFREGKFCDCSDCGSGSDCVHSGCRQFFNKDFSGDSKIK